MADFDLNSFLANLVGQGVNAVAKPVSDVSNASISANQALGNPAAVNPLGIISSLIQNSMKNNSVIPSAEAASANETSTADTKPQLSPYQEGVSKGLKKKGEQHAIDGVDSGVPPTHIEYSSGLSPVDYSQMNKPAPWNNPYGNSAGEKTGNILQTLLAGLTGFPTPGYLHSQSINAQNNAYAQALGSTMGGIPAEYAKTRVPLTQEQIASKNAAAYSGMNDALAKAAAIQQDQFNNGMNGLNQVLQHPIANTVLGIQNVNDIKKNMAKFNQTQKDLANSLQKRAQSHPNLDVKTQIPSKTGEYQKTASGNSFKKVG